MVSPCAFSECQALGFGSADSNSSANTHRARPTCSWAEGAWPPGVPPLHQPMPKDVLSACAGTPGELCGFQAPGLEDHGTDLKAQVLALPPQFVGVKKEAGLKPPTGTISLS